MRYTQIIDGRRLKLKDSITDTFCNTDYWLLHTLFIYLAGGLRPFQEYFTYVTAVSIKVGRKLRKHQLLSHKIMYKLSLAFPFSDKSQKSIMYSRK